MGLNFKDGDVPFDINGTDRDSNLLPATDRPPLPDELQKKLDDYNRNFEALSNALGDDSLLGAAADAEVRIEKTREMLVQALPTAVRTILELANYSLSDSIRLKAAVYIIDRTMGKENIEAEDQATKLFRKLQGTEEGG